MDVTRVASQPFPGCTQSSCPMTAVTEFSTPVTWKKMRGYSSYLHIYYTNQEKKGSNRVSEDPGPCKRLHFMTIICSEPTNAFEIWYSMCFFRVCKVSIEITLTGLGCVVSRFGSKCRTQESQLNSDCFICRRCKESKTQSTNENSTRENKGKQNSRLQDAHR